MVARTEAVPVVTKWHWTPQDPYAYFLLGLTTLTVATDGVTDPAQAWQIAGLYLSRHRLEPWFLDHMRQETESLLAAISDEFNILTTARSPGEKLRSSRLNEAFAALQEKVNEIRDHGVLSATPLQTAIAFAGHFAAIRPTGNATRRGPTGSPDSNSRMFGGRKGETCRSGSQTSFAILK
jgi:hypothetical protein